MASPLWYFGPDYNLRALECPDTDIDLSVEQYGGIFQGLNGARTQDITGIRQKFVFNFQYMDDLEFAWINGLYRRAQGATRLRLISPMGRNLLSTPGSLFRVGSSFYSLTQGVSVNGGVVVPVADWPAGVADDVGNVAIDWFPGGVLSFARIDSKYMFPCTPGVQMTASVYAKAVTSTGNTNIVIDWYDKTLAQLGGSVDSGALSTTTSWTRKTYTFTPPANAVTARMAIKSSENQHVRYAAAQVEKGTVATAWQVGGYAPLVVFGDSLGSTSPRFPLQNVSLTLLEA